MTGLPDRVMAYMHSYTTGDRSKVLDDPDLVGFAFFRGTTICYLNHVRWESDGNVTGIIGDLSNPGYEIVSISAESLFLDCFRWMASKSVKPHNATIHVGEAMDLDTLAIVVIGDKATDEELIEFGRAGRTDIYPPAFADDHACIVGVPRAFPIFRNDSLMRLPLDATLASNDPRDLWMHIHLHSQPVTEAFAALPGFSWMALWEFPGMICPGTVHNTLKFVQYVATDPLWLIVHQRISSIIDPARVRARMKRPLAIQFGSNVSQKIVHTAPTAPAPGFLATTQPNTQNAPTLGIPATIHLKDVYTNLSLFYCVLDVDQNKVHAVHPPTFNPYFQRGLETATDKKTLFKYVQRNYLASKKDVTHSKHHLCNYVDYSSFHPTLPLFNLFAEASMLTKPFQTFVDPKELAGVVSLASFALPKKNMGSYREYLAVTESNVLDLIAEQSKEKMDAMQTKLFPFTFFDRSFDDVLTAVANFLAFSQSIVQMTWDEEDVENPTIVRMMLQVVQLAKHKDLRNVFSKATVDRHARMPWVYHSLFLSFQTLFQQTALFLMSPVATMAVQSTSLDQIPLDEFAPLIASFSFICKELRSMTQVLTVCADSYKVCPDSCYTVGSGFVYSRERPTVDGDRASTFSDRDKEGDTQGWLKLLDRSKRPVDFRPPALSETLCVHYAFEGYKCKFSSCVYKHCKSLSSLSPSDQAIVKSYVEAHPNWFALNSTNAFKRGGVSTKKTVVLAD